MISFFSSCLFGHGDAIKDFARDPQGQIIEPKRLVFRCQECQQELRQPLQDQQLKIRKIKRGKVKKVAKVLRIAGSSR
jgi:Zn finger protein HypA/HybF involved in hydrogenase expression